MSRAEHKGQEPEARRPDPLKLDRFIACKAATEELAPPDTSAASTVDSVTAESAEEIGGPKGLEPTRFGDWERKGRCIDF